MLDKKHIQAGIFAEVPNFARYVFFDLAKGANASKIQKSLGAIAPRPYSTDVVAGIGLQTTQLAGYKIEGLREFAALQTKMPRGQAAIGIPTTPTALLLWLRGDEPAALVRLEKTLTQQLSGAFAWRESLAAFKHTKGRSKVGRDLTGYEDGTENPKGAAAMRAAFVQESDPVLHGSSFLAVQRWQHDWHAFGAMSQQARDHAIGRRQSDNQELEDAPKAAHVRRTAQEDFDPEAFVLRRSMPWRSEVQGQQSSGLMFAAFGQSFDAFEAQMRRMSGLDDGVVDALFQFSRPLSTSYVWCPPAIMQA